MEQKTDRRVQKTRKLLSEALISLMLEKSYDSITVQEILDRANVGRATFYMHYEGKEQLLLSGHANLDVKLFGTGEEADLMLLLTHIYANRKLAKALLGERAGNIMFTYFKNNLAVMFRKQQALRVYGDSRTQYRVRYKSEAAASAICSLLTCWIADDFFVPLPEFASQCTEVAAAIINT